MKWGELRRMLRSKLKAEHRPGTKHDRWFVSCDDIVRGFVTDSHGEGEMRGHEIGHVARGIGISERQLRDLVSCTMSREEYCAATA